MTGVCVSFAASLFIHDCVNVNATKSWILEQDAAYCLRHPRVKRADLIALPLSGIQGNEITNPVEEVSFEFHTLHTFERLTCLRDLERISIGTVMTDDIDIETLAKLPVLNTISFGPEAREDTPHFNEKMATLRKLTPSLKIIFDSNRLYDRHLNTLEKDWVTRDGHVNFQKTEQ